MKRKVLYMTITFNPESGFSEAEIEERLKDFIDRLKGLGYQLYPEVTGIHKYSSGPIWGFKARLIIDEDKGKLNWDSNIELKSTGVELPINEVYSYIYMAFSGGRWDSIKIVTYVKEEDVKTPYEELKEQVEKREEDLKKKITIIDIITFIIGALLIWLLFWR